MGKRAGAQLDERGHRIFICGVFPSLQGQLLLIRPSLLTATSSRELSLLSLSSLSTISSPCYEEAESQGHQSSKRRDHLRFSVPL